MTALVFALPFEASGLQDSSLRDCEIWILGTTGRRAVKVLSARLEREPAPELVVSTGFAGALHPGLSVGDLLRDAVGAALPGPGSEIPVGQFQTVESIVGTAAGKAALYARTRADLCDMESGHVAALCRERGIPYAGLRCVSDESTQDFPILPDSLTQPGAGKSPLVALLTMFVLHPTRMPAFFRMVRSALCARGHLTLALEKIFGEGAS